MSATPSTLTDRAKGQPLARYAQGGDISAFEALVNAHLDWVHAAARRQLGDEAHLADDVTQAVFLLLYRKAGSIRDEAALAGWLFRATRYAVYDARRASRRRRFHERKAAMLSDEHAAASVPREGDWTGALAAELDTALAQLREVDRRTIVLRFYRSLPVQQVARVLGISEEAAKKRLGRALERLRAALRDQRIAVPSVAALGTTLGGSWLAPPAPAAAAAAVSAMSGGAIPTAATAIAEGAGRMLLVLKVKVMIGLMIAAAAAIGLPAVLVQLLPSAEIAAPLPNAAPPLVMAEFHPPPPPLSGQRTVYVAQWTSLLDAGTTAAIRAGSEALASPDGGYAAHQVSADRWPALKTQIIRERLHTDDHLGWYYADEDDVFRRSGQELEARLIDNVLKRAADGERQIRYSASAYRLRHVYRTGAESAGFRLSGTIRFRTYDLPSDQDLPISFDGDLPAGSAVVFLVPMPHDAEPVRVHMVVCEAVGMPVEYGAFFRALESAEWWLRDGAPRLEGMSQAALGWEARAPADDREVGERWTRALSDGRRVRLRSISRSEQYPFIQWNPEGGPLAQSMARSPRLRQIRMRYEFPVANQDSASVTVALQSPGNTTRPVIARRISAASLRDRVVEVGVAVGDWREIGPIAAGQTIDRDGVRVTLDSVDTSLGATHRLTGNVSMTDPDAYIRIVAVTKDGLEKLDDNLGSDIAVGRPEPGNQRFSYSEHVGETAVERYVVKVRKREWVRFEGFAAEPIVPAR